MIQKERRGSYRSVLFMTVKKLCGSLRKTAVDLPVSHSAFSSASSSALDS